MKRLFFLSPMGKVLSFVFFHKPNSQKHFEPETEPWNKDKIYTNKLY